MHHRSLSELQGASPQRRNGDPSRSSWTRMGSALRGPPTGAQTWVYVLLGALLVPGAWSFLSEEQEELLVELHNFYRGQVSPSASAMLPLKWDPNLKVLAEGYAAKCIWNHNPDLEEEGENLYASSGPPDLREALEKWFLEHHDYDYQNNSCDENKMCGHYTQMVWADTHRVGCAFHLCNTMEGLGWERVSFLVCNYFPAGNFEDQQPYVEGDWCSSCPENLQKCENNLCVPDVVDEEEEAAGSSALPPDATNDAWTETPAATTSSTPRAPSVPDTVPTEAAEDTPPPGTTDVPQPTSGRQEKGGISEEEEEAELREASVFVGKQGIREKVHPRGATMTASASAAATASTALTASGLACLAGLLTQWL